MRGHPVTSGGSRETRIGAGRATRRTTTAAGDRSGAAAMNLAAAYSSPDWSSRNSAIIPWIPRLIPWGAILGIADDRLDQNRSTHAGSA